MQSTDSIEPAERQIRQRRRPQANTNQLTAEEIRGLRRELREARTAKKRQMRRSQRNHWIGNIIGLAIFGVVAWWVVMAWAASKVETVAWTLWLAIRNRPRLTSTVMSPLSDEQQVKIAQSFRAIADLFDPPAEPLLPRRPPLLSQSLRRRLFHWLAISIRASNPHSRTRSQSIAPRASS